MVEKAKWQSVTSLIRLLPWEGLSDELKSIGVFERTFQSVSSILVKPSTKSFAQKNCVFFCWIGYSFRCRSWLPNRRQSCCRRRTVGRVFLCSTWIPWWNSAWQTKTSLSWWKTWKSNWWNSLKVELEGPVVESTQRWTGALVTGLWHLWLLYQTSHYHKKSSVYTSAWRNIAVVWWSVQNITDIRLPTTRTSLLFLHFVPQCQKFYFGDPVKNQFNQKAKSIFFEPLAVLLNRRRQIMFSFSWVVRFFWTWNISIHSWLFCPCS